MKLDALVAGVFILVSAASSREARTPTDTDCDDDGFLGQVEVDDDIDAIDPHVAVGLEDVVLVTNEAVSVFDKSGTLLFEQTTRGNDNAEGFWEDLVADITSVDALVHFDSEDECFWIVAFRDGYDDLLIAVREEADPPDEWRKFLLDTAAEVPPDPPSALQAIDRPNSSVDDTAVYVNFWGVWTGGGENTREALIAIDKQELLDASSFPHTIVHAIGVMMPQVRPQPNPNQWRRVPAVHGRKPETGDTAPLYLLQVDPDHVQRPDDQDPSTEFDQVVFHAVTLDSDDPWGTAPTFSEYILSLGSGNEYFCPRDCNSGPGFDPCARQLNGGTPPANTLSLNDVRFLDGVYRDGYFRAVHHARPEFTSLGEDQIRYSKFAMNSWPAPSTTPSLADSGWIGAEDVDCYYPSVAVNEQGTALILFNQSGADEFVSIRRWDSNSETVCVVKESTNFFNDNDQSNIQRWGDFSGAASDPDNYCIFWGHHLWVDGGGNGGSEGWRTWVSEMNLCENDSAGAPRRPRADLTRDGTVDIEDLLKFQARVERGDNRADWCRDGRLDALDFVEFLNAWNDAR